MPYRPSFERGEVWKPFQAIVPTGAIASIAISLVAGAHFAVLVALPEIAPDSRTFEEFLAAMWADPALLLYGIATTVVTLAFSLLVLVFPVFLVLAGILMVAGLPVAWLLGRHVRGIVGIPVAILAGLGALYCLASIPSGVGERDTWLSINLIGAALMTALLYRHFLIAFRDEDELLD